MGGGAHLWNDVSSLPHWSIDDLADHRAAPPRAAKRERSAHLMKRASSLPGREAIIE